MLVLSRRNQQEFIFRNLGIRIRVLKVQGQIVKLGIDAPAETAVLRGEIATEDDLHVDQSQDHRRRNELNLLHLKVLALQRRIDRGEQFDAQQALDSLLKSSTASDLQLVSEAADAKPMSTRPRLLVVEDNDNERRLLAYVLTSHGFEVTVARDGEEAMHFLTEFDFRPVCVLMDINMPMFDGTEVLKRIRGEARLESLKVIAVSGCRQSSVPLTDHWDGWFLKPVNVGTLLEALREDIEPRLLA